LLGRPFHFCSSTTAVRTTSTSQPPSWVSISRGLQRADSRWPQALAPVISRFGEAWPSGYCRKTRILCPTYGPPLPYSHDSITVAGRSQSSRRIRVSGIPWRERFPASIKWCLQGRVYSPLTITPAVLHGQGVIAGHEKHQQSNNPSGTHFPDGMVCLQRVALRRGVFLSTSVMGRSRRPRLGSDRNQN